MISIIRTDSKNADFIELVRQLDAYLKITDGDENDFYHQFNGIDSLNKVVVIYENENPIGCGAIKLFEPKVMEVKRMYVHPNGRRKGIASKILKELEDWTKELGYEKCVLETGKRQVEAVKLYQKNNYTVIPNYGQYVEMENSICFEKKLIHD